MSPAWPGLMLVLLGVLLPGSAWAHIGNPTTIYEGFAGTVPVRVSVRVPTVVPGLAEINVRVLTNLAITRVTALPAHWQSGPEGMPPPDVCKAVAGETNLYHAELWLMVRGAYSVNVSVETPGGSGKVLVPVNAIATTVLPMPRLLGAILAGLGLLLFLLAASSVGAAVRESVLEPGAMPSRQRLWLGRGSMVAASLLLLLGLWGGWVWWQKEARHYRDNRVHKPARASAEVREVSGRSTLRVALLPPDPGNSRARVSGLVPDHGKLMHLFLIHESNGAAFAHLHPARAKTDYFESVLPPLLAGRYHIYADVTHETGFSQTVTSSVQIAAAPDNTQRQVTPSDPDDSWFLGDAFPTHATAFQLGTNCTMTWDSPASLKVGREVTLRFRIQDGQGAPVEVQPYMSMLAHAVVWQSGGAVFTHLHPTGSMSVAAQQVFQLRSGESRPRRITPEMMEAMCQPPGTDLRRLPISFPYEFPNPGRYRIWVQVKIDGTIRTGVFDTDVAG